MTLGLSQPRAVLLLYALATCSGALALGMRLLEAEVVLLLVPGFALKVGKLIHDRRIFERQALPDLIRRNVLEASLTLREPSMPLALAHPLSSPDVVYCSLAMRRQGKQVLLEGPGGS